MTLSTKALKVSLFLPRFNCTFSTIFLFTFWATLWTSNSFPSTINHLTWGILVTVSYSFGFSLLLGISTKTYGLVNFVSGYYFFVAYNVPSITFCALDMRDLTKLRYSSECIYFILGSFSLRMYRWIFSDYEP